MKTMSGTLRLAIERTRESIQVEPVILEAQSSNSQSAHSVSVHTVQNLSKRNIQVNGIFLDRDGVIIRKAPEGEYITQWAEVEFLPGSIEAIARLHKFGFKVIIVTNQRGVAMDKIPIASLEEIHSKMRAIIADRGGVVSAIYCCTHDISESCLCRKPKPGMLLRAAKEFTLNLTDCWMVGATTVDIEAGKTAGCKTALITQAGNFTNVTEEPDVRAESLEVFVQQILASLVHQLRQEVT
jgi:D-glycero-D-manno-heptose 1,7-bisphosphate phosphatase